MFKQNLRSRFTCLARQHLSFHAKKSLDRERPFSLALWVVSLFSCLSGLAPSVTRVVICVSRVFCSTDQEKRETARSLANFALSVLHGASTGGKGCLSDLAAVEACSNRKWKMCLEPRWPEWYCKRYFCLRQDRGRA